MESGSVGAGQGLMSIIGLRRCGSTRPSWIRRHRAGTCWLGLGPFAIERGLVAAEVGETRVRIFDVNTGSRIEAIVQTPGGVGDVCRGSAD